MASASGPGVVDRRYFLETERKTEVIFPNVFTPTCPSSGRKPEKKDVLGDVKLPVSNLIHATHKAEHLKICRNSAEFEFISRQKCGKKKYYDKRLKLYCGGSYRSSRDKKNFYEVQSKVFTGFYSWWGLYPTLEYVCDVEDKIEEIELEDRDISLCVPGYLQAERKSPYGSYGFVCSLQSILTGYAKSRSTRVANIYLKVGGTLRYAYEICYVIIVCIGADEEALKNYIPLQATSKFYTNGLINESGRIINPKAIPKFCPQHVVSWFINRSEDTEPKSFSYETLAFALYYPREGGSLKISSRDCCKERVYHDPEYCNNKQPQPAGGRWQCPDKR